MVFPRRDAAIYQAIRDELGDERYLQLLTQSRWGAFGWIAASLMAVAIGTDAGPLALVPAWAIGFPSAFLVLRTTIIFNRARRRLRSTNAPEP